MTIANVVSKQPFSSSTDKCQTPHPL